MIIKGGFMEKDCEKLLREINLLNKKYSLVVEGRKDIVDEIRQKIKEVKKITDFYNVQLDKIEKFYSYRDYYINDYKFVMNLLLRLANNNDNYYSMKEITVTDYFNIDGKLRQFYGKVLFITDNYFMKMFSKPLYYYDEFRKIATDAIDYGKSMIIVTNNYFEPNVKPMNSQMRCNSIVNIRNSGVIGDITCYLNDFDLKREINKFINYVKKNGPDFSNIEEDTLFELINNVNKNKKMVIK